MVSAYDHSSEIHFDRPAPPSKATSLDNLPRINQRREVQADNIHLEFDSIIVLNHGAYDGILDSPVVQIHADLVTDFDLALGFLGWHGVIV